MRLASASAVPGCMIRPSTSEPSLNAGRKARGSVARVAAAAATTSSAAPNISRQRPNEACSKRV